MKKTTQFLLFLTLVTAAFGLGGEAEALRGPDPELPEAAQMLFLRGTWEVTIRETKEDGSVEEKPYKPIAMGYYLPDGRTFQVQFMAGGGKWFYSTQLKAFDGKKGKWTNVFVNAKLQRWSSSESQWIDGELITTVPGGYSGDEPFISRERDTEISAEGFVKKLYTSHDEGKTWEEQKMVMIYKRVSPQAALD